MPTYEYRCAKCGRHFDVYQSFSEEPLTRHENCGGKLNKVLSPAGIVLKGSGFYKTDSRSGSKRPAEKSEKKDTAKETSSSSSSSDASGSSSSGGSSSDSSHGSGSSSSGEAKSA